MSRFMGMALAAVGFLGALDAQAVPLSADSSQRDYGWVSLDSDALAPFHGDERLQFTGNAYSFCEKDAGNGCKRPFVTIWNWRNEVPYKFEPYVPGISDGAVRVPEPEGLLLFGLACLGMAAFARTKAAMTLRRITE